MKTSVQKWGNSLALRIPKPLADEVGIAEGSPVELSLRKDTLIIRPGIEAEPDLEELLAAVTEENLHREVEAGPAMGDEAW